MRNASLLLAGAAAAGVLLLAGRGVLPPSPPVQVPVPAPDPAPATAGDGEEIPVDLPGIPKVDPEDVPEGPGSEALEPPPPSGPPGSVLLRLFDGETGTPVSMEASLWRLGLPEDAHWTEGDEEVRSVRVDAGGTVVEGLDPGRYRLSCDEQRREAEDPPEFRVVSGENRFEGPVAVPRSYSVHLRLFDEEGRPVESAVRENRISSVYTSSGLGPGWATRRYRKLPDGTVDLSISFGSGVG